MSKYADQVNSMVQFLLSLDVRTRWTMNLTAVRDFPERLGQHTPEAEPQGPHLLQSPPLPGA